jgi:protein-disulfide isomerase
MKESSPSLVIPTAIALGGIIIALAVYLTVKHPEGSTASGAGNPSLVTPVSPADHIFGNPSAKVDIIEYADFDCEYCKQFDTSMQEIMSNEGATGDVAWVYRNYPITQLHPNADTAAEAAECVAKVSGNPTYWKFADSLFANQPVAPLDYLSLAQEAGADTGAVSSCMQNASTTVDATINAQSANAVAVGAQGTPYSIMTIEGQPPVVIDGAWPYSQLKTAVDAAISEASAYSSTSPSL